MPHVSALLRRLTLPAFAAAALAACDASTAISNPDISYSYRSISLGQFHGGDNALRVVVYGNPFDDPPDRVANAIVAGMQDHNGGPQMTFSAAPAPPPKPRWRVIMVINPVDFYNTQKLCKMTGGPETAPSQDGRIHVIAAFCQGDFAATQGFARAKDVTALDSRNLDQMLALLTRTMFPTRNPSNDRSCNVPCLLGNTAATLDRAIN
jgi:hypothetical protein